MRPVAALFAKVQNHTFGFGATWVQLGNVATILVVEDHEILRLGLRSMVATADASHVEVLEAETLGDGLRLYGVYSDRIALVLLDLNLPDSKGFTALETFIRTYSRARIVVLSGSFDEAIAEEARVLGAYRFFHKASQVAALGRLIEEEARAWLQRGGAGATQYAGSHVERRMRLSTRELEILDLVLQGRSNQEIVNATGLRMGTVKNYISGLLVVFGAASRSKLISHFK